MQIDEQTQQVWFASHVRRLVNAVMDNQDEPDADGDYVFHGDDCFGYIQPERGATGVRITALAAREVPDRVGVLRELNAVNLNNPVLSVALTPDGGVTVTYRLPSEGLSEAAILGGLLEVISVADGIGPMLAAVFGGRTPKQISRQQLTES